MNDPLVWQWALLVVFGVVFYFIAPHSRTVAEFFAAKAPGGRTPGVALLTSSLVISWIFAKSITNAANLGLAFGLIGGVAYAVYYGSFIVGGWVIYRMRQKGDFASIHQFLQPRFGRGAVVVFSLLIGIRLFNEVWSNTMVIGSYFGDAGSSEYYMAILGFTGLTLAYALKGGLRSSLLTDAIQLVFFGVLLVVLLAWILPTNPASVGDMWQSGDWTMALGGNLLFAALIQIFSYPFHAPVLTDRGFIAPPKTTLKSYLLAGGIGFVCILAFSFLGIAGRFAGVEGQAAVEMGKLLGVAGMLLVNFIMITSAASTLDSTFAAFSKLMVVDLAGKRAVTVKRGRLVMIALVVLGTLPVFANPEILSATTVSGTMIIGLAPVFVLWNRPAPAASFHLSVGFGLLIGLLLVFDQFPEALTFTTGKYASLLWANFWGTLGCFILFEFGRLMSWKKQTSNP
ncbi:MAG: sodium:solute symporter [Salibacteraceae bacterium]